MSIYRGYYEGLRNMQPTAVSQVMEALCKLLLGLTLAILVMKFGQQEFAAKGTVFGRPMASQALANSALYPWSAAASIVGITVGTLVGFLYLILRHAWKGDGITLEQLALAPPAQPRQGLQKELIKIAIPIVLSSTILNVTNFIDNTNVKRLLGLTRANFPDIINAIYGRAFALADVVETDRTNYIWGVYNTTLDFRTLVPMIVTALGVSALPAISAAYALHKRDAVQSTINSVLRVSMMVSLPAGFGMAVLARQIMQVFYENKNPGMTAHAAPILMLFGVFTWLMSISAPILSMLQGIGRTDVPVKTLMIGTAAKLGANYMLVSNPRVNVNGAAIGTVIFFSIIVAGNLYMLLRVTKTKLKLSSVIWKPLLCAGLSAAAAWVARDLATRFTPARLTGMLQGRMQLLAEIGCAMAAAVVVYAVTLLLTKAVNAEDLEFLPKGKKIGKLLAKHGLLG
jgi:stage V sporulation protein B